MAWIRLRFVRKPIAIVLVALVLLPVCGIVAWLKWRDHKLMTFCEAVKIGAPIADLLRLERRYGIDGSYMVAPEEFDRQTSNRDLDFRTFPLDPGSVCWIRHNGEFVTSAEIVQ
jgi:hypothetical protein